MMTRVRVRGAGLGAPSSLTTTRRPGIHDAPGQGLRGTVGARRQRANIVGYASDVLMVATRFMQMSTDGMDLRRIQNVGT